MTQNTQLPLLPVSQAVADPHTQGDRERQYQLAAAELVPHFFSWSHFLKNLALFLWFSFEARKGTQKCFETERD